MNEPPRSLSAALAIALFALFPHPALAQPFPSKPVRLVVGLAQGGGLDVAARIVAARLPALLGQPVIVENRVGANGNVAAELVAKSAPDGYALLVSNDSMMSINPHIYARMPIDVQKDLVPVAALTRTSNLFLIVHPSLPVRNFQDFVQYARTADRPLAYATPGYGSQHHLAMEMLNARAGIRMLHVPYKGAAPAAAAIVAGEVAVMIGGAATVGQMASGKLRGLAATGRNRAAALPDLPTIAEFYPGYELITWIGTFSPAGLPEGVGSRLRTEVNKTLAMPEVAKGLAAANLEPYIATAQEFGERVRADHEKYGRLVKQFGIKVDN